MLFQWYQLKQEHKLFGKWGWLGYKCLHGPSTASSRLSILIMIFFPPHYFDSVFERCFLIVINWFNFTVTELCVSVISQYNVELIKTLYLWFHAPQIRTRLRSFFFVFYRFNEVHWSCFCLQCSLCKEFITAALCIWLLYERVNGVWVTITGLFSITDKAAHCTQLSSFPLLRLHWTHVYTSSFL